MKRSVENIHSLAIGNPPAIQPQSSHSLEGEETSNCLRPRPAPAPPLPERLERYLPPPTSSSSRTCTPGRVRDERSGRDSFDLTRSGRTHHGATAARRGASSPLLLLVERSCCSRGGVLRLQLARRRTSAGQIGRLRPGRASGGDGGSLLSAGSLLAVAAAAGSLLAAAVSLVAAAS